MNAVHKASGWSKLLLAIAITQRLLPGTEIACVKAPERFFYASVCNTRKMLRLASIKILACMRRKRSQDSPCKHGPRRSGASPTLQSRKRSRAQCSSHACARSARPAAVRRFAADAPITQAAPAAHHTR